MTHIIVEQLHGHWSAWFRGTPQVGFGGEFPSEAIRRLLAASGLVLEETEIVEVAGTIRDGHMEYLIPD